MHSTQCKPQHQSTNRRAEAIAGVFTKLIFSSVQTLRRRDRHEAFCSHEEIHVHEGTELQHSGCERARCNVQLWSVKPHGNLPGPRIPKLMIVMVVDG